MAFQYDDRIIVEEYIQGKEITVGILEEKPLPVIQILTKRGVFDYKAKYEDGFTKYLIPAPIKKSEYKEAQKIGLLAHISLGCRTFSRVDMILNKKKGVVVLEINTIPGLTVMSLLPKAARADGIGFNQLCVKILESALNITDSVR